MSNSTAEARVLLWNDPVARMLIELLAESDAVRSKATDAASAMSGLLRGDASVSLLPSDLVLSNPSLLDVLPAVAVSSIRNPFSTLSVPRLGERRSVDVWVPPEMELHGLVAEIVLKEQYGCVLRRVDGSGPTASPGTMVTHADAGETAGLELDLGLEWYELVNYPMVWALFVTRKGEATPGLIRNVRDSVLQAEAGRRDWVAKCRLKGSEQSFYGESVRYRLDDVAFASLTELSEYLYYYGRTPEIPQPVPITYEDSEED